MLTNDLLESAVMHVILRFSKADMIRVFWEIEFNWFTDKQDQSYNNYTIMLSGVFPYL